MCVPVTATQSYNIYEKVSWSALIDVKMLFIYQVLKKKEKVLHPKMYITQNLFNVAMTFLM